MSSATKSNSRTIIESTKAEPSLPDAISARIRAIPGLADHPIIFLVSIHAKPGAGRGLGEHLDHLAHRALAGGGATTFAIHRDAEDGDHLIAEEHWRNLDAWLAYVNGPDVAETAPKVEPLLAEPFRFTFLRG
jgi:quinol monooxygenase YgiN